MGGGPHIFNLTNSPSPFAVGALLSSAGRQVLKHSTVVGFFAIQLRQHRDRFTAGVSP